MVNHIFARHLHSNMYRTRIIYVTVPEELVFGGRVIGMVLYWNLNQAKSSEVMAN